MSAIFEDRSRNFKILCFAFSDRQHLLIEMSKFYQNDNNPYPSLEQNEKQPSQQNAPKNQQKDIFQPHEKARDPRSSVFLKGAEEKEEDKGCCDRCCSCLSLDYYKDNFKVTNQIVFRRMKTNLKFWSGGFFQDLKEDYDLYGPVWLYTTMVFVCSAVHNVMGYSNNQTNFDYNFGVIGVAFGIFYILGLVLSAVFGLLFGCMGLACKTTHIVCLYGYSMTIYVICVLLCIINMSMMTWLFLLYAGGTKVAYVLKNIFEKLEVPASKKVVILVLVIAEATIQLLAIRFALLSVNTPTSVTVSHFSATHFSGLNMRTHEGGVL